MKYNPLVVVAYWQQQGCPVAVTEHRFHPERKWRFDFAFPEYQVYVECDGGIWIAGGHNRGAQMLKDWEKRNAATVLGWRGLWCQPKDLCTLEMADTIKNAIRSQRAARSVDDVMGAME